MKTCRIIRVEKTKEGMLGVLTIDGIIHSYTLELDDTFIKRGIYECWRYKGKKWPDTFEIKVKGHSDVLFHAGNTEADTKGCVLLGETTGKLKGNRAILNSGNTFKSFMQKMADDVSFILYIEDRY